jgi:S-adenosylmethionine synthetase
MTRVATPSVSLLGSGPASPPSELVERKGVGHPDTICDALAENLSRVLSRTYLERFGAILHHNVDKSLLVAGSARPAFGGGEVREPIEIYLAGRATTELRGVTIPIDELAIASAREWLRAHVRYLDPERHVRIVPRIRRTSPDLASLFLRGQETGVPLAGDTSMGVGFAPLRPLERGVLAVERHLNAADVKARHPEIGEDVKVMGVRHAGEVRFTVACAFVDRHVRDLDDYRTKKARVCGLVADAARAAGSAPDDVLVNAADGDTADGIYLTVTGLSAESGDDGQVGRGNRVNGLITPYRPMSLEALAGKNPVAHVGKLYNVVATRAAAAVVAAVPGVEEAGCFLSSRIGRPLVEPELFDVAVRLAEPRALATLEPRIAAVARAELDRVHSLWREAVDGALRLW